MDDIAALLTLAVVAVPVILLLVYLIDRAVDLFTRDEF